MYLPPVLRPLAAEGAIPPAVQRIAEAPFSVVRGVPGSYAAERLAGVVDSWQRWNDCVWLRAHDVRPTDLAQSLAAACRHRWSPLDPGQWAEQLPPPRLSEELQTGARRCRCRARARDPGDPTADSTGQGDPAGRSPIADSGWWWSPRADSIRQWLAGRTASYRRPISSTALPSTAVVRAEPGPAAATCRPSRCSRSATCWRRRGCGPRTPWTKLSSPPRTDCRRCSAG